MKTRPKKFNLGSHEIKIRYVKSTPEGDLGIYFPGSNEIWIRTHNGDQPLSESIIMHSIFHEIVHAINYHLHRIDLFKDEVYTDNVGLLLSQIFVTIK